MTVYVVRHGKAGSRSAWTDPDDQRPLTKAGRKQAAAIADSLEGDDVTAILTSPYVRCRQTVEPLAQRLRLPVDLADGLEEGAPLVETLALLDKLDEVEGSAVLCTHGDVMGELLHHCMRQGVHLEHDRMEKGSTWVLETEAGAIVSAHYVPPPA